MTIEAAKQKLFDDFASAKADGHVTAKEVFGLVIDVAYLAVDAARQFAYTPTARIFAINEITAAVNTIYPQIAGLSWAAYLLGKIPGVDLKAALVELGMAVVDREIPPPVSTLPPATELPQ